MEAVAPDRRLAGRYLLEELLATGGMATVWRGRDDVLARTVAIKILSEALAGDPTFVERFRREAVAAAGLVHPHVVQVFDTGSHDGVFYIVLEHFESETLEALAHRIGPFQPEQAAEVTLPVLAALGAAHHAGLVHRDISPRTSWSGWTGG